MALKDLAQQLLNEAVAALASPPTRRYVALGIPPADCEQLIVAVDGALPVLPDAGAPGPPLWTRSASVELILDRCAPTTSPTGMPPTPAALDAFYKSLMDDVDALWAIALRRECWDRSPSGLTVVTSGGITRVTVRMAAQW